MSEENNSFKDELPLSKSGYKYPEFVKLVKKYIYLIENYATIGNLNRKIMSKDDIIVINNLLEEILEFVKLLAVKPLYQVEFFTLFKLGIRILDLLKGFKLQNDILLYQKIERMKFLKVEYYFLIGKNNEEDALKAEIAIDDMIQIQKEKDVARLMTNVNIANLYFLKAHCRLQMNDVNNSLELTNEAVNYLNDTTQENETEHQEDIRIETMSKMFLFLAELYDLLKE